MQTIAGGTEAGDGGRAQDASLRFLQGLATDTTGNIYISDADDNRIRRIDPSGRIMTIAGDGLPGFSGDGGPANRARINTPYGLSVTPLGDLIFADLGNARVRRIRRDGLIETLIGGGSKDLPAPGTFLRPLEVKLSVPRNVLATASGSIFVSDFGANRVLELQPDLLLTTMPVSNVELRSPAGLTLDSDGHLLVADSGNSRIRRLRRDGRVDIAVPSTRDLPLDRPTGLARLADGSILISDTRGDYLWQISPQGASSVLAVGGRDVAVSASGAVITAGGSWLRRINPNGLIDILIGNQFQTWRGDAGPALAARLNRPQSVVGDSKGNLYVADTANHRVRCIRPDGIITTVAGNGEQGFRGDRALATEAFLNSPTYLAVDAFDNIYVSDTGNHRVRVFTPGGVIQTVAGTGLTDFSADGALATLTNLFSPAGLAFDRSGNLYVAERGRHRIRRFPLGGRVSTIAGSSLRGNSGDGQEAVTASLNGPGAIGLDSQGNLYIVDAGNNSIRSVDSSTGLIRTLRRDLKGPEGIAVTPGGTLYFTESLRQRVQQLTPSGDLLTIAGITDSNGFNGDAGDATALTLNQPHGIALLADGRLVVADRFNDRIRRLEAPPAVITSNVQTLRVVHAATFAEGAIAPGQWLSLLATEIATPELAEITLDSMAATISFAGKTQINFQAPYAIAGRPRVNLELRVGGALVQRLQLDVAGANPGWFESSSMVVAVRPDGRLVSDQLPARAGDVLTLYATGEGLLRESGGLTIPFLTTSVEIGGVLAELLYAGAAPGFSGLLQVNLRVPENIRLRGRLPITLQVGTFQSPRSQVLAIQ
jgi:uncharacterized protein (TIGR03437 family)